jgi:hypothetical protein
MESLAWGNLAWWHWLLISVAAVVCFGFLAVGVLFVGTFVWTFIAEARKAWPIWLASPNRKDVLDGRVARIEESLLRIEELLRNRR